MSIKVHTFAPANEVAWSLRLSVRTRDFHSLKRSSTLLGTTKRESVICAAMRYQPERLGTGGGGFCEKSAQGNPQKYKTHRLP